MVLSAHIVIVSKNAEMNEKNIGKLRNSNLWSIKDFFPTIIKPQNANYQKIKNPAKIQLTNKLICYRISKYNK